MPGGLLNLISYGNQNIILNGNPSKTFFKCVYAKYTNFGLQKFRIDFDGLRNLRMSENSVFKFKIPRYADLLMDTYLVVTLPTIWSPILPPTNNTDDSLWKSYEFKWIKDLGTQLIENIRFTVGGVTIQEFKGQYLKNLVERDFDANKKELYYKMTGNIPELNDPKNALDRNGYYPNVYPNNSENYEELGPEPSIRSRQLFIPINIWFTLASKMAFPLISLQYQELNIEIELKSIDKLYVIRDIEHFQKKVNINNLENVSYHMGPYIRPNLSNELHHFYRFLQPPPWKGSETNITLSSSDWEDKRTDWAADIHLISTYAFLSDEEIQHFATKEQSYLIKDVYCYKFENMFGSKKIRLNSCKGMVANWMWFFQRNDVFKRNQWSNYTNWPYETLNTGLVYPNSAMFDNSGNIIKDSNDNIMSFAQSIELSNVSINPYKNMNNSITNYKITDNYDPNNTKSIMLNWALVLDGKYRENVLPSGIFQYLEKYTKSNGFSSEDLYSYNFCFNTSPYDCQPSGAMNFNKFKQIEFEINTIYPSVNPNAVTNFTLSPEGACIAVDQPSWGIYNYTYTLYIFEESYNVLSFMSGNAGLMYAR